ncbi:hypothetical protein KIN20_021540 [Parelaphostrongylus tenuis]|uniref:Uncharacterized protein n=1 Tax=Parelaphostrongylus tenuis TaxID=148309 RepID=A0AAD5MP17_PARTN|nr:hypothetical protein KIN20_021540 [Parelaphostrongylus tenuis]
MASTQQYQVMNGTFTYVITWRQNDCHAKSLTECYLALKHEHQDILKGKKALFTAMTFSSGEEGKEVVILELGPTKSLTIRKGAKNGATDALLNVSNEGTIETERKG